MKKNQLTHLLVATLCLAIATSAGHRATAAKPITNPDGTHATTLVLAGGTFASVVQPDQIPAQGNYIKGIIWDCDARDYCSRMGLSAVNMDHLDDCKSIDDNTKILITSSAHWTMIVDYATKDLEFWTTKSSNAHSAEVIPGNLIAVACSTPCNQVQLYDRSKSNVVLGSVELSSAHGVVWNDKRQRLYAVGGQKLLVCRINGAGTDTPTIEIEKTIKTPQKSCHDLSPVDENTLCVSGRNSYLFDIDNEAFTELTLFHGATAIKSVNYNINTGEVWYTDATNPEGDYSWSTQTAHHALDPMGKTDHCTFKTQNLNLYKVRVMYWGGEPVAGINTTESNTAHRDTPAEWYTLQGIRVANPTPGTLCIRRQGDTASKEIVR